MSVFRLLGITGLPQAIYIANDLSYSSGRCAHVACSTELPLPSLSISLSLSLSQLITSSSFSVASRLSSQSGVFLTVPDKRRLYDDYHTHAMKCLLCRIDVLIVIFVQWRSQIQILNNVRGCDQRWQRKCREIQIEDIDVGNGEGVLLSS